MIFSRKHHCEACAAKDQTIVLLVGMIEWHRQQELMHQAQANQAVQRPHLQVVQPSEQMWATEEMEDIEAALESGAMDTRTAEAAMARIQAMNTSIERVS